MPGSLKGAVAAAGYAQACLAARVMHEEGGQALGIELAHRQQQIENAGADVLGAQEVGERVNDQKIDAAVRVQLANALHEATPFLGGGQVRERLRKQAQVAAEVEAAAALDPEAARLFGDDDGLTR